MSAFRVGDVVEVIYSRTPAYIGRQLVVVDPAISSWTNYPHGPYKFGEYLGVRCSPRLINGAGNEIYWHVMALRKINPPDWSVPVREDAELSA